MKKQILRFALALASLVTLVVERGNAQADAPRLTMQELQLLTQQWEQGQLTYANESSARPVAIRSGLNGMSSGPYAFVLDYIYQQPEGGMVKEFDKLWLARDGRSVRWDNAQLQLRSKTRLPDGRLQAVFEGPGREMGQPCELRRVLTLGSQKLEISKEVRRANTTTFVALARYEFTR
jgi:hypothetical protein